MENQVQDRSGFTQEEMGLFAPTLEVPGKPYRLQLAVVCKTQEELAKVRQKIAKGSPHRKFEVVQRVGKFAVYTL